MTFGRSCLLSSCVLLGTACGTGESPDSRTGSPAIDVAVEAPVEASVQPDPICPDDDRVRGLLIAIADTIVARMSCPDPIFVGGYAMRALVASHEILGTRSYLEVAVAYGDSLLAWQRPDGYWATGYGPQVYLADTASALGLFMVLFKHVDGERRARYRDAIERHVAAIRSDGLIHDSGAIGVGWGADLNTGRPWKFPDEYTIASALTGGELFTWMFHVTGERDYLRMAQAALSWVLTRTREDGVIPYVLAREGGNWNTRGMGFPRVDQTLWEKYPYDTSTYVGEGLIAFDTYCDDDAWRAEFRKRIAPHIEFLLRTQNTDGSWGRPGSEDRLRSPGVVNVLVWYHTRVSPDPRIPTAVCRFAGFLADPERSRELGVGVFGSELDFDGSVVTAHTGRALADLLSPGVDARW